MRKKIGKKNTGIAILFSTIIAYAYPLFFAIFSILGIQRPAWGLPIYAVTLLFGALLLYFRNIYCDYFKIRNKEGILFLFLLFVFFSYFLVYIKHGINIIASDTMKDFLVRSIPAILIAIVASKNNYIKEVSRLINLILIVFTVCSSKIICVSILKGYSSNNWEMIFNYDYQSASYMAAYTVGIALYKLCIERNSKFIYKIMYIYTIISSSLLSIYSGGRGGVVLCIVYFVLLCLYYVFIEKKAIKLMSFLFIIMIIFLFYFNNLMENSQLLSGFTRAFEFIGDNGINWEGTSGRKNIYQNCLEIISKHPIFGYGITGAPYNGIERAHNIILDILIDGGIVYLIIWGIIWWIFLKRTLIRIKLHPEYALLVVIFVGDFIMLFFSGVYMRTAAMWFSVTYIFVERKYCYKKRLKNEYFNVN